LLKEWFAKFLKTQYALPAAIALITGVNYFVLTFLNVLCFASLLTPAAMVGIFWMFQVKQVKKLLILGLITALPLMGVLTIVWVDDWQATDSVVSTSEDGTLITNGTLEPLFGTRDTVFTFNATVNLSNVTAVQEAHVIVYNIRFPAYKENNYSMDLVSQDNLTAQYSYGLTEVSAANEYLFAFLIDGEWVYAGDVNEVGVAKLVIGPLLKDSWSLAGSLAPFTIMNTLIYTYIPYAIICGMIWWTRRARRMRLEAIERLEAEREKKKEELPKDKAKVPSLASAMGLSKEDMFVCSECGADVPGDAKACPKCGEKFE